MPNRQQIQEALCNILAGIQQAGGYAAPILTGSICPLRDLEGFDSFNTVEVSCQLSADFGCEIMDDVALFACNGQPRTIDEIVDAIYEIIEAS